MGDELRDRLRRIDPMHPGVPTEAADRPPARDRLERIMSTPTPPDGRPYRPRLRYALAAGAAAAALTVAGVAVFAGGSDPAGPPLELSTGDPGIMASCLPVGADLLADMPVAFAGTVDSIDDERITLSVDRWYRGGDAGQVELTGITDLNMMISVIDFRVGEQYLITATDGRINYCGFSAPATPELEALFEEAYGG
jgi:hypothetical protein